MNLINNLKAVNDIVNTVYLGMAKRIYKIRRNELIKMSKKYKYKI